MPTPFLVHAAVLAGGKSTRMQTDKRFLKIQNEYFVDRAIRIAHEAVFPFQGKVFLCGDVPERSHLLDEIPELGPLSGIKSATLAIEQSPSYQNIWLLVLPIDMPLLSTSVLYQITTQIKNSNCWAICFKNCEMPFAIYLNSTVKNIIHELCTEYIPTHKRSLCELFKKISVKNIELAPELNHQMFNINSPSDYHALCTEIPK